MTRGVAQVFDPSDADVALGRHVGDFGEELAPIKKGNVWGFISRSGIMIIEPKFASALSFHEGLAGAKQGSYWGYIDRNARWIIKPAYESADDFVCGMAAVKVKSGYLLIRKDGKPVVDETFLFHATTSCGVATVGYGYLFKPKTKYLRSDGQTIWIND